MRISELIKRLENIKSEHGDLYVLHRTTRLYGRRR